MVRPQAGFGTGKAVAAEGAVMKTRSTEDKQLLDTLRQAGRDPLDYSSWDANKKAYIAAIHAGLGSDYAPMAD